MDLKQKSLSLSCDHVQYKHDLSGCTNIKKALWEVIDFFKCRTQQQQKNKRPPKFEILPWG